MGSPDLSTASLAVAPITPGFPSVVDDHFRRALTQGAGGGPDTQLYFDTWNETSTFWGWLAKMHATGQNPWVDGLDPQGNRVVMASNGNVDMRIRLTYTGPADNVARDASAEPPVLGIATVSTGNTTSEVTMVLAVAIKVAEVPGQIVAFTALWNALLSPIWESVKNLVGSAAARISAAVRVEDPTIDLEGEVRPLLEEASVAEEAGEEAAAIGIGELAINWTTAGLAFTGMAALAAAPMIVEFMGHEMTHVLQVHNLTATPFTWTISHQASGKMALQPSDTSIPGIQTITEGGVATMSGSYQATFQVINRTNLTSLGYVVEVTPVGGGASASLLISVPWAGSNTIWVGSGAESGKATWKSHHASNGQVRMRAEFGTYAITLSINRLTGETDGSFFYASMAVIEPLA